MTRLRAAWLPVPSRHPVVRAWPWTIALAAVLAGFVLLGLVAASLESSVAGVVLSLAVAAGGLLALVRVLSSGVHVLPSGLLVRELTRSTAVPWAGIRAIETAPTGRRGSYAPVLVVVPQPVGGRRRGEPQRLELTVLASYREDVAERRTAELLAARPAGGSQGRVRS